jgi:DNA-binding CsgD family transcriptional regulator
MAPGRNQSPVDELDQNWPDLDRQEVALGRVARRMAGLDPFPERSGSQERRVAERALTPGERHCLQGVAAGLRYHEVADVLGLSSETVRTNLERARRILGAKTMAHAVALALREGQIT